MIEKVKVYQNGNVPIHLAVDQEHKFGDSNNIMPVCGSPIGDTQLVERDYKDLNLQCQDCAEQLKMWREVKEMDVE